MPLGSNKLGGSWDLVSIGLLTGLIMGLGKYRTTFFVVASNHTVDEINLNSGNYGIFLIMGNAGFISSTVTIVRPGFSRVWD